MHLLRGLFFILSFFIYSSASATVTSDGCRLIFNPDLVKKSIENLLNPANKDIQIETCGESCLKVLSETNVSFTINSDENLSKPEIITSNQAKTLRLPSEINLEPSELNEFLTYFLVGHENHPYVNTGTSFLNKPEQDRSFQDVNSGSSILYKPEQERAFQAYQQAIESKSKSFLHIAPVAFGKTAVLTRALRDRLGQKNEKKLTIVTAHENHLVHQLLSSVKQELQQNPLPEKVNLIDWKNEPADFFEMVISALESSEKTVLVITTQSLKSGLSQLKELNPYKYVSLLYGLDAVFIDEAHHLGAPETQKQVYQFFERSGAFLYGTTATPIHRELVLTELFETTHWSYLEKKTKLTKENKGKAILQQLSEGIAKGEVTPFDDLYIVGEEAFEVTNQEPLFTSYNKNNLEENNRREEGEEEREGNNRKVLNPIYYKRMAELMFPIIEANKKGFIVTATIQESEQLSNFLNKTFPNIEFSAYHSQIQDRASILKKAEENKGSHYIVAVRAMDEGVNLPWLSAYIDLNTNVSVTQMIHRLGRVLRIWPGKIIADALFLTDYRNDQKTEDLLNLLDNIKRVSFKRGLRKEEDENTSNTRNLTGVAPDFLIITRQKLKSLRAKLEKSARKFWDQTKPISLTFKDLKKLIKDKNITSKTTYYRFARDNTQYDLSTPPQKYPEWNGWDDFFDIVRPSLSEIQTLLKDNQILTKEQFNEFRTKHLKLNLPEEPETFYEEDWLFILGIDAFNPDGTLKQEYLGLEGQVKFAKDFTQGDTKHAYESIKTLLRQNRHFNTFDKLKWIKEDSRDLKLLNDLINSTNNINQLNLHNNPSIQALQIQAKLAISHTQGSMSKIIDLTTKVIDETENHPVLNNQINLELYLLPDWQSTKLSAKDILQLIRMLQEKGTSYTGYLGLRKLLNDYQPNNKNTSLDDFLTILNIILKGMKLKTVNTLYFDINPEEFPLITLEELTSTLKIITEEGSVKKEYIGFKGFNKFIQEEHAHFFKSNITVVNNLRNIETKVANTLQMFSNDNIRILNPPTGYAWALHNFSNNNIDILKWPNYKYFINYIPKDPSSKNTILSTLKRFFETLHTLEEKITDQDGMIKPEYKELSGFINFIIKDNENSSDLQNIILKDLSQLNILQTSMNTSLVENITLKDLSQLLHRTQHEWLNETTKDIESQYKISDLMTIYNKEKSILSQIFKKTEDGLLSTEFKDAFANKYSWRTGLSNFVNFVITDQRVDLSVDQILFLLHNRLTYLQLNQLGWHKINNSINYFSKRDKALQRKLLQILPVLEEKLVVSYGFNPKYKSLPGLIDLIIKERNNLPDLQNITLQDLSQFFSGHEWDKFVIVPLDNKPYFPSVAKNTISRLITLYEKEKPILSKIFKKTKDGLLSTDFKDDFKKNYLGEEGLIDFLIFLITNQVTPLSVDQILHLLSERLKEIPLNSTSKHSFLISKENLILKNPRMYWHEQKIEDLIEYFSKRDKDLQRKLVQILHALKEEITNQNGSIKSEYKTLPGLIKFIIQENEIYHLLIGERDVPLSKINQLLPDYMIDIKIEDLSELFFSTKHNWTKKQHVLPLSYDLTTQNTIADLIIAYQEKEPTFLTTENPILSTIFKKTEDGLLSKELKEEFLNKYSGKHGLTDFLTFVTTYNTDLSVDQTLLLLRRQLTTSQKHQLKWNDKKIQSLIVYFRTFTHDQTLQIKLLKLLHILEEKMTNQSGSIKKTFIDKHSGKHGLTDFLTFLTTHNTDLSIDQTLHLLNEQLTDKQKKSLKWNTKEIEDLIEYFSNKNLQTKRLQLLHALEEEITNKDGSIKSEYTQLHEVVEFIIQKYKIDYILLKQDIDPTSVVNQLLPDYMRDISIEDLSELFLSTKHNWTTRSGYFINSYLTIGHNIADLIIAYNKDTYNRNRKEHKISQLLPIKQPILLEEEKSVLSEMFKKIEEGILSQEPKEEYIGFKGFSKFLQERLPLFEYKDTQKIAKEIREMTKEFDAILKIFVNNNHIDVFKWPTDYLHTIVKYLPKNTQPFDEVPLTQLFEVRLEEEISLEKAVSQFLSFLDSLHALEEKITDQNGMIKPKYKEPKGLLILIMKESKNFPNLQHMKITDLARLFRRTKHNWVTWDDDFLTLYDIKTGYFFSNDTTISEVMTQYKKEEEILSKILERTKDGILFKELKDDFVSEYSGEKGLNDFINFLIRDLKTDFSVHQILLLLNEQLTDQQKNLLKWKQKKVNDLIELFSQNTFKSKVLQRQLFQLSYALEEKITDQNGMLKEEYKELPNFIDLIIKESKNLPDDIQNIKIIELALFFREKKHHWVTWKTSTSLSLDYDKALDDFSNDTISEFITDKEAKDLLFSNIEKPILSNIFKSTEDGILSNELKEKFVNKYSGGQGLSNLVTLLTKTYTDLSVYETLILLDKHLTLSQQQAQLQWIDTKIKRFIEFFRKFKHDKDLQIKLLRLLSDLEEQMTDQNGMIEESFIDKYSGTYGRKAFLELLERKHAGLSRNQIINVLNEQLEDQQRTQLRWNQGKTRRGVGTQLGDGIPF